MKKLDSASENIKKAFQEQEAQAAVSVCIHSLIFIPQIPVSQGPWDQEKFESLLMEWIIACDQPFDEVKKPEFVAMMNHMHHGRGPLSMPKHEGMK